LINHYLPVAPGVTLHYRDNASDNLPPLLLLHSLSDNSHVFDAVIAAGLNTCYRVVAPDMRGRGDSSRPPSGYSLENHATDLIALLDALHIDKAFVAGHSFGGLLGLYFAAHHPERVLGLVMIDAAVELHPATPAFVTLLADRLGKWYPSAAHYIAATRAMPFVTYWDDDMRTAFLADTTTLPDNSVYIKTQKMHMVQCALAVQAVTKREWRQWALRVPGPSLVLFAKQPFLLGQHIVPTDKALETAVLLRGGAMQAVSGNHVTMMFGAGAIEIATHIIDRFSSLSDRLTATSVTELTSIS
jgi:pimeloyl-ACP methyl ester carboxylesterase